MAAMGLRFMRDALRSGARWAGRAGSRADAGCGNVAMVPIQPFGPVTAPERFSRVPPRRAREDRSAPGGDRLERSRHVVGQAFVIAQTHRALAENRAVDDACREVRARRRRV